MLARNEQPRLNDQTVERSVDPPESDLDTDDELFGERTHRNSNASTSSNIAMEDVNRETISSNVSLENVTQ